MGGLINSAHNLNLFHLAGFVSLYSWHISVKNAASEYESLGNQLYFFAKKKLISIQFIL